jgi:hypothetical protein
MPKTAAEEGGRQEVRFLPGMVVYEISGKDQPDI